ncbi:MAG: hypothetical protein LJE69_15765 [Thiohalocapsa sp.]|jgi:hypothetical protein|uniref:hypothetical protein n=1 Tax=Thiohalocapsa sp. TaxID=2497641 RepID=UPI0025E69C2F|nr:hypothetical protein [Thiohalocapsa sp.]MCG6942696.1 hypothetical protein [Thiohalocapsa sp.]
MWNARLVAAFVVAWSLSIACISVPAAPARDDGLFRPSPAAQLQLRRGRTALRGKSRAVQIDPAQLGRGRLRLNLGVG